FDVMDGLPGLPRQREPFPTAARSADGRLWFATSQGLAVIDPQHLPRNRVLPPVKIEAVRAEGQSVAVTPGARLNPHTRYLEIEYTALSLTAPERVAFRYLLEGYDRDWRGPVTTRQASYTNLPPGHYRFRLIASNNDGVWNETGAAWDFFIEPALYQRRWFQVAVAIALGASFTGLYHLRLRRIKRHNAKLLQENTERRRAEADLRKTRAYMTESERLSLTGSFSWVLKTGELFWSCELYRIYELDASTVPTLRFVQSRVHPQDVDIVKRTTIEAVRGRKDFSLEYRLLMPDGSVKFLEVLAHATLDDHGDLVEYVGAVKDVTEQKKAEGAMHGMCAQIAHVTRVATLGELTASIAHEVNQPLGSIVTNASAGLRWLAGARPNLEEAREALQWIVADGNRAGDIVKRIRSLVSKAESEPVPTDLNELVRETIPLVQWELRQADVNLHWELDSRLPRVLGDRVQLQQVILNLVINGLEAMAGIESGPRDMTIRSRTFGDIVEVAVEDSGTGLDPATVTQIFNAFHTTKPSGMGMGLAICRSIIENHCGRLWAEPNAGPGATFRFALPTHAP
ncbi:MAG TPA: ATP-binding protein, partial [Terrimicrobiaceae bacterium]